MRHDHQGQIPLGTSVARGHLGNAEKNERVQLLETRGTVADHLRGALVEMDAYAAGTRCEKPLYHAAISPEPPHRLTPEQRQRAVETLEDRLGLVGHSHVVVLHEKEGREHLHVVWSRIDIEKMRSVSDSHNYRKHEEVARQLEREFGHDRVQGAHHERDGVARPVRTPSRSELRQEERTGITGKQVRDDVTTAYRASDNVDAFVAALADKGYTVARGDRRDFVVVDPAGGVHSLARRIEGTKAAELRASMAPLDPSKLLSAEEAQRQAVGRGLEMDDADPDRKRGRRGKGYAAGADYVSQSRAAQRDFQERQERLNRFRRAIDGDRPGLDPPDTANPYGLIRSAFGNS